MSTAAAPAYAPDFAVSLMHALGDLVLELSPDGHYVGILAESPRSSFDPEHLRGRSLRDDLPPDLLHAAQQALRAVLQDGVTRSVEYLLPSGLTNRVCEARIAPGWNGNLIAVIRDIHDQRLSEQKLRESENRFRVMADHAPVMLWKSGLDSECDFFNQRWLEFTGRSIEAELGVGWASGIHPADFAFTMDTYMAAFVERRAFRMEYRLKRADGTYRWILDQGAPRMSEGGAFEGFVGSCIDVTDMKESEAEARELADELTTRLAEREVLLREVHHRVKNNLQLISSMHNLQARLATGEAQAQLRDAQRRVHSIALMHERLCEPDTLSDLDFLAYVRDAVGAVMQLGDASRIELSVTGDPVSMSIDQAVPCGLLISELVVNALKHAFPGDRRGCVSVELRKLAEGRVRLSVSDDGVGLPDSVSLKQPTTTGLDLVVALVRQLRSALVHEPSGGTRFVIDIVLDAKGNAS